MLLMNSRETKGQKLMNKMMGLFATPRKWCRDAFLFKMLNQSVFI